MGNGAMPHGPSYRAHPRLYQSCRSGASAHVENQSSRAMSQTSKTGRPRLGSAHPGARGSRPGGCLRMGARRSSKPGHLRGDRRAGGWAGPRASRLNRHGSRRRLGAGRACPHLSHSFTTRFLFVLSSLLPLHLCSTLWSRHTRAYIWPRFWQKPETLTSPTRLGSAFGPTDDSPRPCVL
jgi:hypothetical protein